MTAIFPVRARRLHGRSLHTRHESIENATLFPFFTRAGQVKRVMVVAAESAKLRTFAPAELSVSIPFWGPIQVAGRLEELNTRLLDELARMWHFDPWWLLADRRFSDDAAAPLLKKTNCVDLFAKRVSDVFYRRCLDRLLWVSEHRKEGMAIKPYRAEMLPHREETTSSPRAHRQAGWVLAPFWSES